jgi:hypothetical protein
VSEEKRYLRCDECRGVFVLQEDGEEFQPVVGEVAGHTIDGKAIVGDKELIICSVCRRQAIARGAVR